MHTICLHIIGDGRSGLSMQQRRGNSQDLLCKHRAKHGGKQVSGSHLGCKDWKSNMNCLQRDITLVNIGRGDDERDIMYQLAWIAMLESRGTIFGARLVKSRTDWMRHSPVHIAYMGATYIRVFNAISSSYLMIMRETRDRWSAEAIQKETQLRML